MRIDDHAEGQALGEALAAEVQFDVEALGLEEVITARYTLDRHAVRVEWVDADPENAIDFPASEAWVGKIRAVLPRFARARELQVPGIGE